MTAQEKMKTHNPIDSVTHRPTKIIGITSIIISIVLSGFYLLFSWNRYERNASKEAVTLAESLASLLQPEHIEQLSGDLTDLEKSEYIMTKRNLSQLVETTPDIRFAYLMAIKNDELVFLVDSELTDSPSYSYPGQVYEEIGDVLEVFSTKESTMAGPATDRWGIWYSALIPVNDPTSGEMIAVFGLDFPAREWRLDLWYQMIPDMIIAVLFVCLTIALYRAAYHYFMLKVLSDQTAIDEALYHSVFDQVPVGIAIVDDKRFVSKSQFGSANMNPMFEEILGRTSQELANIEWSDITHPDDLQKDLTKFAQFKAGEINEYSIVKRFLKPDGSYVWTLMKIAHFLDVLSDNPMHLCLLDNISAEKKIADSLRESERSKSSLLSNLPGMAYRCKNDRGWTMQFVSAGCYELTGYDPESFINNRDMSFNEVIAPEYRDQVWNEWEQTIKRKQTFKLEYEIMTASGERKWVIEIGKSLFNENGEVVALEGIILDIADRKKAENQLIYNYEHDSFTGLYSRSYLDNALIHDHIEQTFTKKAFIIINLSTVQALSMTYGYNYTQELIKNIAIILNKYATDKYILTQSFENRFVFYIKDYQDKNELMIFSQQIADDLKQILASERIGAGIGVFEIDPDEELDLNQLSKKVLITSEKAIALEENEIGICYYDRSIEMQIERDEIVKRELNNIATSTEYGGLYLQYQPIFDLRTHKISGFEALARLNTKELGLIPPVVFIPIAEQTKLIIPIGWKIISQSFSFLNKLKSSGYENTHISINVSPIQMMKRDFIDNLSKLVNEMQIDTKNVGIEITESAFSSGYDAINIIMNQLKSCGFNVAIDDFGTGYSSLSRERELHIDAVKIDKYFIDKLMSVDSDNAITSDIISIAHKLGHLTIAEGVEYEEQKQYLLENGCDKIQGYLIGKAVDEDAAIDLLKSTNGPANTK